MMAYYLTETAPIDAGTAADLLEQRVVDDYRVEVETVIDTGDAVLIVSPFEGGGAFSANFWSVPQGVVELDETPDEAALRVAQEATNLPVELTQQAVLGTRVVKTERNGKIVRRLVYTYALRVTRDAQGQMPEGFLLGRDYVGSLWMQQGSTDILERKFDSFDPTLRGHVIRYMDIPVA